MRVVHSAAIQDRDGAGWVLDKIRRRLPGPHVLSQSDAEGTVAGRPPVEIEVSVEFIS
jgi:hypothetical protein